MNRHQENIVRFMQGNLQPMAARDILNSTGARMQDLYRLVRQGIVESKPGSLYVLSSEVLHANQPAD